MKKKRWRIDRSSAEPDLWILKDGDGSCLFFDRIEDGLQLYNSPLWIIFLKGRRIADLSRRSNEIVNLKYFPEVIEEEREND